jgi:ribosomal protein S18 acetylase RimI-like enzyme
VITVRPVEPGDIEPLSRHVKPTPLLHQARAQLQRDERALYLVALDDETPVGHVLLRMPPLGNEHPRPAATPEVEDLFVAAACRSAGIGTRLLHEAVAAARARGYPGLGLAVGVRNGGAQRLYERAGFTDSGIGEFWVEGAHETCRYLVKPL